MSSISRRNQFIELLEKCPLDQLKLQTEKELASRSKELQQLLAQKVKEQGAELEAMKQEVLKNRRILQENIIVLRNAKNGSEADLQAAMTLLEKSETLLKTKIVEIQALQHTLTRLKRVKTSPITDAAKIGGSLLYDAIGRHGKSY